MGGAHPQGVTRPGPGVELTMLPGPASLWDQEWGVCMGGVEGEFSHLVLMPTSIIAINSLSYDFESLCLPTGP